MIYTGRGSAEEADVAALDRQERRQSVAPCAGEERARVPSPIRNPPEKKHPPHTFNLH